MVSYLFQGNPDRFDIDGYLQAAVDQDRDISWSVKQHKNIIQPGDTVFLWRAAGRDKNDSGPSPTAEDNGLFLLFTAKRCKS